MEEEQKTSMEDCIISLEKFCGMIGKAALNGSERIGQIMTKLEGPLNNLATHFFALYELYETEYEKSMGELIKSYSKQGWFCDIGEAKQEYREFMSNTVFKEDESGNSNSFYNYFASHLDIIEQRLLRLYPNRSKFIYKAFAAHRERDFISSIPLLFSFADGITWEFTEDEDKDSIFSVRTEGRGKIPKISQATNILELKEKEVEIDAILTAIMNFSAMNQPRDENKKEVDQFLLNRHRILHGKNLDYDNETNSLKLVSLVNYLACLYKGWPYQSKSRRIQWTS